MLLELFIYRVSLRRGGLNTITLKYVVDVVGGWRNVRQVLAREH